MMKKAGLIALLAGIALGISAQVRADDSVLFLINAPSNMVGHLFRSGSSIPLLYDFTLISSDGLLAQVDKTTLMFGPHINVYKKREKISENTPEKQTGEVLLREHDRVRDISYTRCTLHWEHRFWIDGLGKHDRFSVSITNQYKSNACIVGQDVHKSGKMVLVHINPETLFDGIKE